LNALIKGPRLEAQTKTVKLTNIDIESNMLLVVEEKSSIQLVFSIEFNDERVGCFGLVLVDLKKALVSFRRRNGDLST